MHNIKVQWIITEYSIITEIQIIYKINQALNKLYYKALYIFITIIIYYTMKSELNFFTMQMLFAK